MHEIDLISVISKHLFYIRNFPALVKVDLKFKEALSRECWAKEDAPFLVFLSKPHLKVNEKIISASKSTFCYRNECVVRV